MATQGVQEVMKAQYDSFSAESNVNPEFGLVKDKSDGAYGYTQADLADM